MQITSQFKAMIASLLQNRQQAITNADLVKHRTTETTFYAVTKILLKNNAITSQTQPFSEQTLIEISKDANILTLIVSETTSYVYRRITPLTLTPFQGKNLLHWDTQDAANRKFTVVKLMSPDGFVQIKLISADQIHQKVYTVCELPSM